MQQYYIGIDMGGTSIKYGLVDKKGKVSAKGSVKTAQSKDEILASLEQIVQDYQQENEILGIGISAPGVIKADGYMQTAGAIACLYGANLKEYLEQKFKLPVTVENDANAAALAEGWFGAAKGCQNYLALVLGTGVGGGIIINGQIYRGANGHAGEFGWALMTQQDDPDDLEYGSLNFHGATVLGLTRLYDLAKGNSQPQTDARQIFIEAKEGLEPAKSVMQHYLMMLSKGIFNLVTAFDPEVVVLGGAVSANETFRADITVAYEHYLHNHKGIKDLPSASLKFAQSGNDAGLIGAVYSLLTK
ncbi:ROK family protein [Ligilactobacillus sp. Marseille-Q7487]|uniref:ROK family protein n=1 Tax=Ligilactobacillus sp. Marseille-Q7487 TaxID=3022128 RepID=UPI0024A9E0A5|nr:ROK family protein [Ligilactobacillus sp. Marseille-Q7487]